MSEHLGYPPQVFKIGDRRGYDNHNGYNFDPCSWMAANTAQDIRGDLGRAEAGIKETIHAQSVAMGSEFCGLSQKVGDVEARLGTKISDAECRLATHIGDKAAFIIEKVDREADRVSGELQTFRVESIREFGNQNLKLCEAENRLTTLINSCCCRIEGMIQSTEISRLKDQNEEYRLKILLRDSCGTPGVRVP